MNDIDVIYQYILYLKKQCGLYITLHPLKDENVIAPSKLILFNIHESQYCVYLKTYPEIQEHCIASQEKMLNKCADGAFCGVCHAGVKEYVYPIKSADDIVGFICVSGYKSDDGQSYIERTSNKYQLSKKYLQTAYENLKDDPHDREKIDTLIMPLCKMLELSYLKTSGLNYTDFYQKLLRWIRKNHNAPITSKDICENFSCSRSYLSHNFKQKCGKSLREYLNDLRVEDAKILLEHSTLSIMEIASAVGYDNSNYFTDVFKKYVGLSPQKYRRLNRNNK